MNKVYIEGYEVGFSVDAIGNREKKIQVASGEIVSIDENFIYKSIETEKVKVQQFVAEKIEYLKKTGDWDLFQAMDYLFGKKEIRECLEYKNNQETFARAWMDGYEVEEEKRYLVKVKGMNRINGCLANNKKLATWYFGISGNSKNHRTNHTRKELEEAGFGWVFDCPGIEIEEVE